MAPDEVSYRGQGLDRFRCGRGVRDEGVRLAGETLERHLAADGIVVLSIDFRMPPEARYPTARQDVNLGIRYLKANAERFGSRRDLVVG